MTPPHTGRSRSWGLRLNLWTLGFTRRWLRVVLIILGLYVTLPFAAPTLMEIGWTVPGKALYTLYSPFCHQFAFRSFFLYGEQPVYPRENAGTDWRSFESYTRDMPEFAGFTSADEFTLDWTLAHKNFLGNEQMGYKLTLCERDIFIYIALFTGGLIYSHPFVRRRLRPAPLLLYAALGILPIALDGFSQLLGYPPFNLWPPRETLPEFRVITGFLFGFMTAWLGFPYIELTMRDTRRSLERKLRQAYPQLKLGR